MYALGTALTPRRRPVLYYCAVDAQRGRFVGLGVAGGHRHQRRNQSKGAYDRGVFRALPGRPSLSEQACIDDGKGVTAHLLSFMRRWCLSQTCQQRLSEGGQVHNSRLTGAEGARPRV